MLHWTNFWKSFKYLEQYMIIKKTFKSKKRVVKYGYPPQSLGGFYEWNKLTKK